jgi:Protein of unknown function (DUF3179)
MKKRYLSGAVFLCISAGLLWTSLAGFTQDTTTENCTPRRFASQWANTDFCNTAINFDEIISGGPPKDGIPAITNPVMEAVAAASTWLVEQSPVIVVELEGEARAYPQALLIWHEIANDTIADVPIAITFCPLCNSSIVFDRRVNGEILDFGVSGVLRNSDMVMYDRQTESWWQQFTGEGIVGVYTGTLLDIVPSQVVGFGQFAERYPDGLVMSRDTGYARSYGSNPYTNYDQSNRPFLFDGEVDPRLPATERVLAGELDSAAMAYPFAILAEQIVINDVLGATPVVVFWQPGVASSLDRSTIDESRDIGTAALYERTLADGRVLDFEWDAVNQVLRDTQTASEWNLFGEAVAGELAGTVLQQQIFAPHFWFAWAAFEPDTLVYGED